MQRTFLVGVFVCLTAAFASRGDVTFRMSYDVKVSPLLPHQAAEGMKSQLKHITDSGMQMQLKGNRAVSNVMGFQSISDFDGEIITLIDAKQSRYATAQKDEYVGAVVKRQELQMKQIPEQARKAMDQMKTDVTTKMTGKTLSIRGIEAEERLVNLTLTMPGSPGAPMRMEFSLWTPKEEEMARNPMLRELRSFAQRAYLGTDPGTAAQKMFTQVPGMASASAMMSAFKDSPVILGMRMSMFVPRVPGMAANNPPASGGTTPSPTSAEQTPLMELSMNLEELSSAEVPDSAFRLPREYSVVAMDELLPGLYEQFARPKAAAPDRSK